jgi:hypothetical protein
VTLNNIKNTARKLEGIVAVYVHNPAAFENSLPNIDCINLYPTVPMLEQLIEENAQQLNNILVI